MDKPLKFYPDYFKIDNHLYNNLKGDSYHSVEILFHKINQIGLKYFPYADIEVTIVPDKTFYTFKTESVHYEIMNYANYFIEKSESNLDISLIDIDSALDLDSYYYTDRHWNQLYLEDVVTYLTGYKSIYYPVIKTIGTFSGDFEGDTLCSNGKDTLSFIYKDYMNNLIMELHDGTPGKMYAIDSIDKPYGIFINGINPFIKITNPLVKENQIVIFGDSYCQALLPLLSEFYSEIWFCDLRFMHSSLIPEYIPANIQSVLFIYSDWIVLNSNLLR